TRDELSCERFPSCGPTEEPDIPEPEVNPSTLQYTMRVIPPGRHDHEHEEDDWAALEGRVEMTRGRERMPSHIPPSVPWNSALGRRQTKPMLSLGSTSTADSVHPGLHYPDGLCTEPDFFHLGESTKHYGITVQLPASAFALETDAYAFLKSVKADMPFYFPFRHPDVRLGHGWFYDSGKKHNHLDWSRTGIPNNTDPTFRVYASAPGRVLAVFWSAGGGNTVVIEHTAPSGQKYLTRYMHLRDGKDHDIQQALNCSGDSRCEKYAKFAQNHSDHVSWGKSWHTIQVEVGDWVQAGEHIAWAGNTGAGGAGAGLEDDGTPESFTGNTHLHSSFAVAHPTLADTYVIVDPFGVYGKADEDGCYDLLKDTEFARLYAPFYPTFHGVPIEVYSRFAGYYVDMGWGLRTRSIHRDAHTLYVSGSFQRNVGPWAGRGYMTPDEFQNWALNFWEQDMIMRETQVTKSPGGEPRYSAIWRKLEPGESIEHRASLTVSEFNTLWQQRVVDDGWRVADYVGYRVNGQDRISAFFTSHQPRPFFLYPSRTSNEAQSELNSHTDAGRDVTLFSVSELGNTTRFNIGFRSVPGCWRVYWGRTPSEYQSVVETNASQGYRLEKIQGYANSSRYAAIFYKDGCN
ncbi:MAG: hypothetical protein AAF517_20905, partial [Planctomycetota bacterium]